MSRTHQMHLPAAGCRPGLIDRPGEAPGEDEILTRRLLFWAVADHEEPDAPGILAAPARGRLEGAAACATTFPLTTARPAS
jgi:hypothetical protein